MKFFCASVDMGESVASNLLINAVQTSMFTGVGAVRCSLAFITAFANVD